MRHAQIALAWDNRDQNRWAVEEEGNGVFREGLVKNICGVCAGPLHAEHVRTPYETLHEAEEPLHALEREPVRSVEFMRSLGLEIEPFDIAR